MISLTVKTEQGLMIAAASKFLPETGFKKLKSG